MRLEFEPNASALPFVENEIATQNISSEVETMLREGVKAAQEGNRTEARKMLLRVTDADENNENAWLWLASISEYPEELLVFLNNVLRVNPNNERALEWHKATKSLLAKTLVQRGVDAVKDKRRDFARQCFEQAIEHEAENEMAWLWMASVADSEEEKAASFEKVMSINPDNEIAQASLKSIKSQKTQKLFGEALAAAFDGKHKSAMEMLETVLSDDAELEDAWVLKSHLANSFEERAECFLKLRSLNPGNEMANVNLASWRMLAEKVAAQPKAEEVQEVSAATEEVQEISVEFAEPAKQEEELSAEAFQEEVSNEEFSAEFSNYPTVETFFETEQITEEFTTGDESENNVLEFGAPEAANFDEPQDVQPQPEFFTEEDLYEEEFAPLGNPTQELSFDSDFQPEPEFAEIAAPESAPALLEAEQQVELPQSEEVKNFYEELRNENTQNENTQFEANAPQAEVQEVSEAPYDLAAEMEAEESDMNRAFTEPEVNHEAETSFASLVESDDVSEDIHVTQSQDIHETQFQENTEEQSQEFSNEAQSIEVQSTEAQTENAVSFADLNDEAVSEEQPNEEWRNTSPDVFVNYSPTSDENAAAGQTAELSENQADSEVSEPELAVAEETSSEAVEVREESNAPEMSAENNYLHQFADNSEEAFSAEETVEVAEAPTGEVEAAAAPSEAVEIVEAPTEEVKEQVVMQAEKPVKTPSTEEFLQSKAEMILCPFCHAENEKQAFSCVSCQTILTLSDMEMLLNQQDADLEKLHQAVESLEAENESYGLNAEQLANLGVGHINLKNYRQGFFYLQEAVRMNPNNVLLDAQVNALAIRLSEIEEQKSLHDSMPKNRKILVVDDSPTVRKLISGKLEKCGHEVICAVDGLDALEKINDLMPDLILLDITMPRMDGYQVCKLIRNNETTKDVPVVMISGKDGFFDKVRGRMAGTTGYITKPFGPETLMKTVETYLNS